MIRTAVLFLLLQPFSVMAAIWQVGPGRVYAKPSDVALLVADGDTVEIDAAVYVSDVCVWTKNNLLLKGVGGRPHLRANGNYAIGKGTWVLAGMGTRVENMEFSESAVPDRNGAGIRLDGVGLIVKGCYFHHNENGILTANNGGKIMIEQSEFGFNGFGDGQSHNIYIGRVDTAIIRFSYFHHAAIGHELKSRARVNYIFYNRFSNEATGDASREIDLPSGGLSVIIGNIIQQGANSTNGNMIGYGLEGLVNAAPHEIYLINNTLVNARFAGTFLQVAAGAAFIKVYNNIFTGPGTIINYGGPPGPVDSFTNKVINDISQVGFIDPAAYDYHLSSTSVAINNGTNPGFANTGENLAPVAEYLHPASFTSKIVAGPLDVGAYEMVPTVGVKLLDFTAIEKPSQTLLQWQTAEETGIRSYHLMRSENGVHFETVMQRLPLNGMYNNYAWADESKINPAYYRLKVTEQDGQYWLSKIIAVGKRRQTANTPKAVVAGESLYLFDLPEKLRNKYGQLQILNAQGQLLFRQAMFFSSAYNTVAHHPAFSSFSGYCLVVVGGLNHQVSIPVFFKKY